MELSLLILLAAIVLAALLVPWFEGLIKNGGALIIAAAVVCIAFLLRVSVLQCQTGDYNDFLSQWVQFFRNYGGFSALSNSTNGGASAATFGGGAQACHTIWPPAPSVRSWRPAASRVRSEIESMKGTSGERSAII